MCKHSGESTAKQQLNELEKLFKKRKKVLDKLRKV